MDITDIVFSLLFLFNWLTFDPAIDGGINALDPLEVIENYDLRSSIFFESFFLFNKSRFYFESYEVLDFLETAVCGRTILLFGIFY